MEFSRRLRKPRKRNAVDFFRRGGGGGCRTPVRKRFSRNFSVRRRLLRPEGRFPFREASRHACRSGSFIVHGARKA